MTSSGDDDIASEAAVASCCANCGIKEIDDVKLLKDCDKCDLARYCNDQCQQDHLEKHEVSCKERVAELRDEILFRQPESSHLGDCPICCLPLPLDQKKSGVHTCCCKLICIGCAHANRIREAQQRLKHRCPFCRKLLPAVNAEKEAEKRLMNRAATNDPAALRMLGYEHYSKGDYEKALEYYSRAVELGEAGAHFSLSVMYRMGEGVEKDKEKERYHLEEAAIAGHPDARYNLGCHENALEMVDRAVKHWIIAANLGHNESIQTLKKCYKAGYVSKDDLAASLRAHQAAVDATKSPQREEAAKVFQG